MHKLALAALALVLATFAAVLETERAAACSCAPAGDIDARVITSTAAFVVSVVDREPAVATEFGPATLYRFEVEGSAKGVIETPVIVRSADSGASCGMTFEMGRRYVVFAYGDAERLETGLCSGNEELAADAESPLAVEAVAEGQPTPTSTPLPDPVPQIVGEDASDVPVPLIALAAIGLLLAGAAVLALGRPRA